MHFKGLELIGFKSFAEKTKLNFEPGVTAVVGPNGCGKSNIADAIRWVLGEQSAKSLRASSMQDVIFNGTDTKEPINFAEVSLIFSNEKRTLPIDYDEVTITRRIFRSGDTEYLLNKTPVRLKDISELLMGTGIGTESYSIIEQGKMDLILSSKPEDRRYVFEEASGITKYKAKRKEALRKLEQTEHNLLRINDIIQEVKRQISSIERQARKAERYKVDFEMLKDLETKTSFSDFKLLKTQEATHAVENDDAKTREKEMSSEIAGISEAMSSCKQSLAEVSRRILELKGRISELTGTSDMNTQRIETDRERIEEAVSFQESLGKEVETLKEKVKNATGLIEKAKNELEKVEIERTAKQKSVEERQIYVNNLFKEIDDIESNVKISKVKIVDFLSKETHCKNGLIKLGADIQNRKVRQRRLSIEKETVAKELGEALQALESVLKEFGGVESRVSVIKSELDSKKGQHASVMAEIKAIENDNICQENRRSAVDSKIEMIEASIKSFEGFKNGVKNLLVASSGNKETLSGIVGALADLIKVERSYEEAVSTFLGDDAQVIITERDSDISGSLEYLRANNLGKASFISIETMRRLEQLKNDPRPLDAKTTMHLENFVKIDSKYECVIKYFFRNAYLTESIEQNLKNPDVSDQAAFVTKSGSMVDRGKVSGGRRIGDDESLLVGRRSRLEDLCGESKILSEALLSLADTRKAKNDLREALELDIKRLEEEWHGEEINIANIKTKKDSQEENVRKFKDEIELLDSELDELNEAITELTKQGEDLNSQLNGIEAEKSVAQDYIDKSQSSVTDKRSEKERLTVELASLKTEMLSFVKDEENARSNLKTQEASLFELEENLYSKESDLKESLDKVKSFEDEMSRLNAQTEEVTRELTALNGEAEEIEKTRLMLSDELNITEIQLKARERELETIRNQVRDLDVKLTELSYKKTNLKERILQAYKVDLENVHIELEENVDWDALRSQITELKEKLEKMGPVNLVAIEEHKELEERYSFLTHQQEDLACAKDSLLKAIQKINKTTKELFLETFQKIQVEFKNFFRMLFGGGQAELVLIDEQDILESGIEIVVRPPGKKLQNIMLLSGGEKALTAIALLFGVFKVKPSPFCVLDEIDASLDEANVLRFSNVLKDFLKISQFIIITHNKRTIELADVMYGITMQERGVSKIVSVKFLEKKSEVGQKVDAAAVS